MKRIALSVALLTLAACGISTSQPDAAQSPDGGPDGGGVDSGFDAGSDGGSDAGPTDAGPTDAGATDAGSTDAGTDAGTDGGIDPGCTIITTTPPTPDPGRVSCGTGPTTCDVDGGVVCCMHGSNGPLSGTFDCRLPISCDAMDFKQCDEAADCPNGQQCCFIYGGGTSTDREVLTTCMGGCPYGHYDQACKTDAECGAGNACITYLVNGYTVSTCLPPEMTCH